MQQYFYRTQFFILLHKSGPARCRDPIIEGLNVTEFPDRRIATVDDCAS